MKEEEEGRRTPLTTTRWAWLTSEAGCAHVLELLLVELPLLAVERQRAAPAVVGGAQSDHLLIRPLQEVGPWFVLEIDVKVITAVTAAVNANFC